MNGRKLVVDWADHRRLYHLNSCYILTINLHARKVTLDVRTLQNVGRLQDRDTRLATSNTGPCAIAMLFRNARNLCVAALVILSNVLALLAISSGEASAMVGIKQDPEPAWSSKTFIKLNGSWIPQCSGTLIAAKTVITAAHCHTRKGGAAETSPTQVRIRGQWFTVTTIYRLQSYVNMSRSNSEEFIGAHKANDVAFLQLDRSPLAYGASTAEIANSDEVNSMAGKGVSVFGYGPITLTSTTMSTFIGKSIDGAWTLLPSCPHAREFTAEARCFRQAAWSFSRTQIGGGDSGGPWMGWIGGRWKLLGVVSGYISYSDLPKSGAERVPEGNGRQPSDMQDATMASLPSVQALLSNALLNSGVTASNGGNSSPVQGGGSSGGVTVQPSVEAINNAGKMTVQFRNFPVGRTYYFCHYGNGYPTSGDVRNKGSIYLTSSNQRFATGLCSGSGNAWIGIQATNRLDYYSNQVNLVIPSVGASREHGRLTVHLHDFNIGTAYYFCHSGTPAVFPTGGVITGKGKLDVSAPNQTFSGLCLGRSNAWIGLQAADGHDYFSNQVDLQEPATLGASVFASNNNGQMAVQFVGFPGGTTYYFCHSGNPSDYPYGGVITSRGTINISSSNQSYSSGLCSGRGHAWLGIQASDNHDYYSNQIDLYAPPTAGASISIHGSNGQIFLDVSNFPLGRTYFFCHSGPANQFPTGGGIFGRSSIDISSPNQTFGPLCSGSGNAWLGLQATDMHDYYSNQILL